jgi:photosynthetic reaction center cytochrome c subunit
MSSKPVPQRFRGALIVLLGIGLSGHGQSGNRVVAPSDVQQATPETMSEPSGASRCQFCHAAEVEGYARSAMAHSLRRAGREAEGRVDTADAKITMRSSASGYWQSLTSAGDETNYRIDYVIGSGNHASGYLLDLGGHLFQSPVAYYKSHGAYDLAPGYENLPNPDFTRPVSEGCLFCHAGTALHIAGTSNGYRSPPFSAEAITCERCHGSAEKHLGDPRAGTIVNPAKLEAAARDSICEQCHLLGVGRVLNPGKKFSDYRPGQPLEAVFTTYVNVSPPGGDTGKFKVISHVEQLARSTCARSSNGRLWCGTCHDPHNKPLEPVEFFRSRCLSCHTGSLPASHPDKESNCIGCHMPRRDAKDGGHTAFTDHRIQRHPDPESPLPADTDIAAWREPAPELQKRNLGIAYINAGMQHSSSAFVVRGYRMLAEVQTQFSNDDEFFASLGSALLLAKQTPEAELAFERALQLNPNSVADETNAASAYLQGGDIHRAVAHLERAVALDPLHLPADFPLIELYKQLGNATKADEISGRLSAALAENSASNERAEEGSNSSAGRSAELVFKNIRVLKGVPSDKLIPAMRFISASLGVKCSYCHVPDHFDQDDKKPKQIARDMMRMVFAIDKDSFTGLREVTCYSCHRGTPKPEGVPLVSGEDPSKPGAGTAPGAERLAPVLPTADQLIDHYIQALGGEAAVGNITSRKEQGTSIAEGRSVSVEIFDEGPDKQALVQHLPTGDSVTVFNARQGWSRTPGHSVREIQTADLDAVQIDRDLQFPLHIKRFFREVRVEYPEKMGNREAYVVSGTREGQPPVKLYFDEESGLLVRLVRYADSPLGLVPTQIDYGDYRKVESVEVPFRTTVADAAGISTLQLTAIQQNIPIDDAMFTKPPAQLEGLKVSGP